MNKIATKYDVIETIICDVCGEETHGDKCDKCGKDCCHGCRIFIGRVVENWCADCIRKRFGTGPTWEERFLLAFF